MMGENRHVAIQSRGGWKKRNARSTGARLLARLSRRIRDDVKKRVSLEVLQLCHVSTQLASCEVLIGQGHNGCGAALNLIGTRRDGLWLMQVQRDFL